MVEMSIALPCPILNVKRGCRRKIGLSNRSGCHITLFCLLGAVIEAQYGQSPPVTIRLVLFEVSNI